MKILPLLTLAATISLSTLTLLSKTANAQVYLRECVQGTGSCTYQEYPIGNQRLFLRTTPQASQRRVNQVDTICADVLSSNCAQYLIPRTEELQESNTFQQLRQRQINTIEERR